VFVVFLLIAYLWLAVAGLGAGLVWLARVAYREPKRRLVISIALIFAVILVALEWIAAGLAHQPSSLAASALALFLVEAGCLLWLALTQPSRRRRRVSVATVAAGIILVGPGVFIFVLPSVEFESATVRCGHNPVIASDELFGRRTYYLPGDDAYYPLAGSHYYCSAAEAEAAGYSPR
jgi:uncharacterized membrane protein YczE